MLVKNKNIVIIFIAITSVKKEREHIERPTCNER